MNSKAPNKYNHNHDDEPTGRLSNPWRKESMAFSNKQGLMSAFYSAGLIVVQCGNGVEIKFPVQGNPRLSKGTPDQLNKIEISPFGLHWPDLDEDLSLEGLLQGDYGQLQEYSSRIAEQTSGYMGESLQR